MNKNTNEQTGISSEEVDNTVKELCHLMYECKDETLVFDFFKCLFTGPELKDIANRWLLVKEIEKGTTQREIAKKFSMSLCKITRGSKELSKPDSAFRKMLQVLESIK